MIFRHQLLYAFFLIAASNAAGQSIYHLTYKLPASGDSMVYQALFIRNENGSALARITDREEGPKKFLAEIHFTEEFATGAGLSVDTGVVKYNAVKTHILKNPERIKFTASHFWFQFNAGTGVFEPHAVSATTVNTVPAQNNFLTAGFKSNPELTKDFVRTFFSENDQFYNNLFGPRSKGGLLTTQEKMTRIHLIVVASTLDEVIGPSCRIDAERTVQQYSDVAAFLGIRIIVDSIYGDRYSREHVEAAIKKLNPSASDIVVFYYSGHGFTNPAIPQKKYSFLDLRDPRIRPRPNPRENTLNIEDIYHTIKQKGARLNLVIADCCNDRIEQTNIVGVPPPRHRSAGVKWNWHNVKTLFMNPQKLSLLITAASKDQRATSKNSFGGFYTYYLVSSLNTYLGPDKSNPGWIQVLAEAQQQTMNRVSKMYCPTPANPKNYCKQVPPPPKLN
jgi:hypothetical protein